MWPILTKLAKHHCVVRLHCKIGFWKMQPFSVCNTHDWRDFYQLPSNASTNIFSPKMLFNFISLVPIFNNYLEMKVCSFNHFWKAILNPESSWIQRYFYYFCIPKFNFYIIDKMIMVMQWHFLMDDEKLNFHNIIVILIAFKWFEDIMTNAYIHYLLCVSIYILKCLYYVQIRPIWSCETK